MFPLLSFSSFYNELAGSNIKKRSFFSFFLSCYSLLQGFFLQNYNIFCVFKENLCNLLNIEWCGILIKVGITSNIRISVIVIVLFECDGNFLPPILGIFQKKVHSGIRLYLNKKYSRETYKTPPSFSSTCNLEFSSFITTHKIYINFVFYSKPSVLYLQSSLSKLSKRILPAKYFLSFDFYVSRNRGNSGTTKNCNLILQIQL